MLSGGQPAPCTTKPVLPSPAGWITPIPGLLPDSGGNELGGGPVGWGKPGPAGLGEEDGAGPLSSASAITAPTATRAAAATASPATPAQKLRPRLGRRASGAAGRGGGAGRPGSMAERRAIHLRTAWACGADRAVC